jgi:hypothetical protein
MLGRMRRVPKWAWYAGGGALALLLLKGGGSSLSAQDIDALTRMLLVEHVRGTDAEKAQLVNVALNRARKSGAPLIGVVGPGTRRAQQGVQSYTWNGSGNYRTKFNNAHNDSRYGEARRFIQRVARGEFRNLGYTSFVHPGGMPRPPCASNRVLVSTFAGERCLPSIYQRRADRIGIALFA